MMTKPVCLFVLGTCLVSSKVIEEFCQANFLDSENYKKPQENDQLLQIQIITRHGDRTPLFVLPEENVEWNCETENITYEDGHNFQRSIIIPEEWESASNQMWRGSCSTGQLTKKGMEQHKSMGETARKIYIEKLQFLEKDFSLDEISIRSTDYKRTKESAENFFIGMYPEERKSIKIVSYPPEVENLLSNHHQCPLLKKLDKSCYETPQFLQHIEENKGLKKQLSEVYKTARKNVFTDESDSLGNRLCHQKEMPCSKDDPNKCISLELAEKSLQLSNWEFNYIYSTCPNEQHKTLRMGPFLKQVVNLMKKATEKEAIKYAHYSAHDTSIAPLVALLGGDPHWPPFASTVVFELWKSAEGEYFTRIFFNGKVLQTSLMCDFHRCPLQFLVDYIDQSSFKHIDQTCKSEVSHIS